MGIPTDQEIPKGFMVKALLQNLLGNVFLAWVLAHNIAAWDAHSWGHDNNFAPPIGQVIASAVFTWLGFFVTQGFTDVTWNGKSWKLFFINTTYHLLALLLVAFILVYVG